MESLDLKLLAVQETLFSSISHTNPKCVALVQKFVCCMIQHLDHFSNLLVLILILDKQTHKGAILKTQDLCTSPSPQTTTEASNDNFKGTILQNLEQHQSLPRLRPSKKTTNKSIASSIRDSTQCIYRAISDISNFYSVYSIHAIPSKTARQPLQQNCYSVITNVQQKRITLGGTQVLLH